MGPMAAAAKALEQATTFYKKDLESMTEEQILTSAGGSSRKPVDFTYEVALVNLRIYARLTGTEPPAEPEGEDWWVAPAELQSKAAIIAFLEESSHKLLSAVKGMSEEDGLKIVGEAGRERPAFALANFAGMHTMYHDAQLNFIQSLSGDLAMHWN